MIPVFTVKDIYIMLQTLDTKTLIGFSNPLKNMSTQEIEAEWEKTYKSLHSRGLLDFIDGEIKLEERFAQALWIMSRTNLTVEIVTNGNKKCLFYFGNEHTVECTQINENQYTLYMHGAPDATWNDVIYPRMLAGVEKRPIQKRDKILIPAALYNESVKHKLSIEAEKLNQYNKNHDVQGISKQLNHAIKNKIQNNRLIMFYKENEKWSIEGLHVLTSPTTNWTLKMVTENSEELLEGRQSSAIDIVTEIINVMRRVKS